MSLKIRHKIARAIKQPNPNKVYGAKVSGVKLENSTLVYTWDIFARKPRDGRKKKLNVKKEKK